ncbi:helix-turn-helix domain-containing protein [Oscillospiraceae bacterium WX1]
MPNQQKQVIPVREAARMLGRSKATIEKMMRDGALPFGTVYQRPNGDFLYMIPRKALERYMNGEIGGNVCRHCGESLDD